MNSRKLIVFTSFICILPAIIGLFLYSELPEQLPVQWSMAGEVTSYAPKWFPIMGMPLFLLLLNFYFHKKTDRDHKERNYPEVMIAFLKWIIPALSVVCTGLSIASAMGYPMSMVGVIAFIGTLMVILGVYIPTFNEKISIPLLRSKNNDSCEKLYTLIGRVFIIFGIAVVIFSILGLKYISFVCIAAAVVISMIFSYRI